MKKYDIIPPVLDMNNTTGDGTEKKDNKSPIKVDYPDEPNIFKDTEAEVLAITKEFKNAREKEKEVKDKNTNTAFWFCVYFQDEEQKNEFFEKIGLTKTETAGQYIDGITFAKKVGIQIDRKEVKKPGKFKGFTL